MQRSESSDWSQAIASHQPAATVVASAPDRDAPAAVTVFATAPVHASTVGANGPERAPWCHIGRFGGIVKDTGVRLQCTVLENASLVVSSPTLNKVPALATSEPVTQVLTATLGAGSLLVSVPEPCCCYADARYRQTQIVAMDRDASVVLVDWVTNGRAGLGENWRFASYTSDNRLFIGADLIARHKTELRAARDAADPTTPRSPAASVATAATMGATAVVGSILAFGPRAAPVAAKLRMMASGTSPASLDLLIAVSAAGTSGATTCAISPTSGDGSNGVLALRFCAVSADAARAFVREALADIHEDVIGRPLFGTA